jgi:hypothetical protein
MLLLFFLGKQRDWKKAGREFFLESILLVDWISREELFGGFLGDSENSVVFDRYQIPFSETKKILLIFSKKTEKNVKFPK